MKREQEEERDNAKEGARDERAREQESKRARDLGEKEERRKQRSFRIVHVCTYILYGYIVWSQEKREGGKPVRQRKIYGTCRRYTATLQ